MNEYTDADERADTAFLVGIRYGRRTALLEMADEIHDFESALDATEEIILDAEDKPFRFTPTERRRMAICDVLSSRANALTLPKE